MFQSFFRGKESLWDRVGFLQAFFWGWALHVFIWVWEGVYRAIFLWRWSLNLFYRGGGFCIFFSVEEVYICILLGSGGLYMNLLCIWGGGLYMYILGSGVSTGYFTGDGFLHVFLLWIDKRWGLCSPYMYFYMYYLHSNQVLADRVLLDLPADQRRKYEQLITEFVRQVKTLNS